MFSAPQAWGAGWTQPVADGDLDPSTHAPGVFHSFTLPSVDWSPDNFVRLRPSVTGGSPYFLSYRIIRGYDAAMPEWARNRVSVHTYAGDQTLGYRLSPQLEGMAEEGGSWWRNDAGGEAPRFIVHFDSKVGGSSPSASVRVCWWSNTSQRNACGAP